MVLLDDFVETFFGLITAKGHCCCADLMQRREREGANLSRQSIFNIIQSHCVTPRLKTLEVSILFGIPQPHISMRRPSYCASPTINRLLPLLFAFNIITQVRVMSAGIFFLIILEWFTGQWNDMAVNRLMITASVSMGFMSSHFPYDFPGCILINLTCVLWVCMCECVLIRD